MNVVGSGRPEWDDNHVHTIDVWYSQRRQYWVVERLNVHGSLIGVAHHCRTLDDAEACLTEWLRSHDEAHVTPVRERRHEDGAPEPRDGKPETKSSTRRAA